MSGNIFSHQLRYFQQSEKFRIIAIDPRGQGLSSKTDTGHTYDQRGRDLAAFMTQLNLKDVILIGWSFGTLDIMSYISQYGVSDVKAVMILDGTPKTMGENLEKNWVWIDKADSSHARQMMTEGILTNTHKTMELFVKWMLEDSSKENMQAILEIAFQTPPIIAALTNETASYANYEDTLIKLNNKIPLYLFVRDEWGEIVNTWRERNLPSAKFTHMGKHLMFCERHQDFNSYLSIFLNEL